MIALTLSICCRSADFRPCYGRINELRAFLPAGLPMLASTATVTDVMRQEVIEKLEMEGCKIVTVSPNKPNIFYSVQKRSGDIEHDLSFIVDDIATHSIKARRVIVYCRSLDMCADLYAHFLFTLGDMAYYPTGAKEIVTIEHLVCIIRKQTITISMLLCKVWQRLMERSELCLQLWPLEWE